MKKSELILQTFEESYPELKEVFAEVGPLQEIRPRQIPIHEAIVNIVANQMLSSKVAESIIARLRNTAEVKNIMRTIDLDAEDFRSCGLSAAKAKTLVSFRESLESDPLIPERWKALDQDSLFAEVCSHWGLSRWSASILALSSIGRRELWP